MSPASSVSLPPQTSDLEHPDESGEESGEVFGSVVGSLAEHDALPPMEGPPQLLAHLAAVEGSPALRASCQHAVLPAAHNDDYPGDTGGVGRKELVPGGAPRASRVVLCHSVWLSSPHTPGWPLPRSPEGDKTVLAVAADGGGVE